VTDAMIAANTAIVAYLQTKVEFGFTGWIGLIVFVVALGICLAVGWPEGRKIIRAMNAPRREAVVPVMVAVDAIAGYLTFACVVEPQMCTWGALDYLPVAARSFAYCGVPIAVVGYLFRPAGGVPELRGLRTGCFGLAVLMLNYMAAFAVGLVFAPLIAV